jgi:ribosomal-protein-serine acetyltransferase
MRAQLGSGEVTLRRWRDTDAPALHQVVRESIEHLTPWMTWVTEDYSPAHAARFVATTQDDWARGVAFNYAIFVRGQLAGNAGLMARIGPGGLEIGYWLHPSYVGRGAATMAVSLLATEAFRTGTNRVEIVTDVANLRSAGVPRRLGFVEVARRSPQEPGAPAEEGLDIVWRLVPDRG